MHDGLRRRSGPLFGAALVLVAVVGMITPLVPTVAATDPSADPTATQSDASTTPTPDVTQPPDSPTPAPAPSITPAPSPTDTPAPAGSPAPTVTASPSDSPAPSDSAGPSDSPSASDSAGPGDSAAPSDVPSGSDSPAPSDSALPSGSPEPSASASPTPSATPLPIAPLAPLALVDPNSPHIVPGTLSSDTCGACHQAHTASNTDLLATTYRVDPLRASGEAYKSSDFALCWACHSASKAAIEDPTGATAGTNFSAHGFHIRSIGSFSSGGTDITVAGAGQGNALCAECHYNLHGTSSSERGLVVFAPDVLPYNGQPITYDQSTGNCTLTCHGVNHDGATVPAVAAAATPPPSPSATPPPSPSATPVPSPSDSATASPGLSGSPSPIP